MQFSIRILLFAIIPVAAFFAVARTAGYAVATGTIIALSILVIAVIWRRRGRVVNLRFAAAAIALVAIWFLAVDWSSFIVRCPDCGYGQDVMQHRIFCIPVHTQVVEHPTNIQSMLKDVGHPCDHSDSDRWHKHRIWGLVICACPCINGIDWLGEDTDHYTKEMSAKVRQAGEGNPQLAAELSDLAIRKHDYRKFWRTIDKVVTKKAGNSK